MKGVRIEHDSMGAVEVAAEQLWGAQTQRALQHFQISSERLPLPLLHAMAQLKAAAAEVHAELGLLPAARAHAVVEAAQELLDGRHDAEFPLPVWQSGSGTQTHMNLNEVLARRASQCLAANGGQPTPLHPNDEINLGQSTNDVFPSAMHIAAVLALENALLPALHDLHVSLLRKADAFGGIVKIGRTHLQDAVPLTLGQQVSGWAAQLQQAGRHIAASLAHLRELAIGGTAVGTGLNTHPEFAERMVERLSRRCGTRFVSAPNKFEAMGAHDAAVQVHGRLRGLAVALTKIANDVRWLASGPRAGLGELRLPENEPGSSIMPGKVNPTQCEALSMVCCQIMGNDVCVGLAGAGGQFEMNAYKPVIAHNLLQSIRLLADAMRSFDRHAVQGLQPDEARIAELLQRSLMLVTALSPHIGYEAAAAIALHAHRQGLSLREAALASGQVSAAQFDEWVQPLRMLGPSP